MAFTVRKNFEGMIRVMQIKNAQCSKRHYHEFLEFAYICSGEAQHQIGDLSGVLRAGCYFVVDYNTAHEYYPLQENLMIVNCLFMPELIDKSFAGVKSFNDLCERYFLRITGRKINGPASNQVFTDDGDIGTLFLKLLEEYERKQDGYMEAVRCILSEIIIKTVRKVGSQKQISSLCTYIIGEINRRYREPLTLSGLCSEKYFSLPYASAKFKEETGITFTEFLQNRRIEEACRLLAETGRSVSEIGESVGYSSTKFFNKVFKQITKCTPREYRKNCGA